MPQQPPHDHLDRRTMLWGAGAFGATALPIIAWAQQTPVASSTRLITGMTCPVTPEQTEGPFYFDPRLVRSDITGGKPGAALRLRLQIVAAVDCAPATRARVDVWHCDAAGAYSGYDRERTRGETWLRGTQFADAEAIATFRTIYPGWYDGRAPHIHVKAWLPDGREATSQIYFPDALSEALYAQGAYAGRAGNFLRNTQDRIFRRAGDDVPVAETSRAEQGYDAAVVIVLA
jgi:protocatechuate 3,4-dioxygenase beta subunit